MEKWIVLEICLENYTAEIMRDGKYFDEEVLYFNSFIVAEDYVRKHAYGGYVYKYINLMG